MPESKVARLALPRLLPKLQLNERFLQTRKQTLALCAPLEAEDFVVQAMPDCSPVKWHLAHTTWFFEKFVLAHALRDYGPFRKDYDYLFNSYYETVGSFLPRTKRGLLTRPTVKEIYGYREIMDQEILKLLSKVIDPAIEARVELGIHHEQQHQELILMDLKNLFSQNPLKPRFVAKPRLSRALPAETLNWITHEGGLVTAGAPATPNFTYDCETPRHRSYLKPFRLANRLVTQGEYLEFILDRGYQRPELWLSEGWATVQAEKWEAPLYWEKTAEHLWNHFTLHGMAPLEFMEPVSHLSYFEAEAFARWKKMRLPTEIEWEVVAANYPVEGNFVEHKWFRPRAAQLGNPQLFGDLWEWTQSPFLPYPGFKPLAGALGEYNGKFMCNQFVLRGGSYATPITHIRPTYRNYFPPHARWQFSGFRLAQDL